MKEEKKMPVKITINSPEFGHSLAPEGAHTITTHLPGWSSAYGLLKGDMSIITRLRSLYPRFGPFGVVKQLSMAVHEKLGLSETQTCFVWACPDALDKTRLYACSPAREHKLRVKNPADISETVVRVQLGPDLLKLHVIIGPVAYSKALVQAWQTLGSGASTRLAEALLPEVDSFMSTAVADDDKAQLRDGLPEDQSHAALRNRILELLQRSPIDPERASQLTLGDIYVYPSGMTAICRAREALLAYRPGKVLALGSIFKYAWQLFDEDEAGGMKHFGACLEEGFMAQIAEWLEAEQAEGRQVSHCFLEFPSNPLLVAADLRELRKLADKYGFPIVVDDTIGSFANIDLLPVADVVMTSLSKSFSGYSNVLGGSNVLNPSLVRHYPALSREFAARHLNELFARDASVLVQNSADYLARTAVLNRNASAMAAALAHATDLVVAVNHPAHLGPANRANYDAFLRRPSSSPSFSPTADATTAAATAVEADPWLPGDTCLLSVDFSDVATAVAFYDACAFAIAQGPHLGAHRTLAIPFSTLMWHLDEAQGRYHAAYGCRAAQVRLSAGLEDEAELVAVVETALAEARLVLGKGESGAVKVN